MTEPIEKSMLELDFASLRRRKFTPSPAAWEDQVLYFLLLDRFSDGKEKGGYRDSEGNPVQTGSTPLYQPENSGRVDYDTWLRAGGGWQGGTLAGLRSKLGYLRRLGITALWVSPPFRQVAFEASYHGYGIQNFLDVGPHFGTREEFRAFVRAAHDQGIYAILDIVAHHPGNVFSYAPDRYATHDPATGRWYAACLGVVYCFWIAYADLDGFRIDAAKHMPPESLRAFCDLVREFAQSLGKERFLLVGEVGGVEGDQFRLLFWYAPKPAEPPPSLAVERKGGPLAVRMTLPPSGFVIYQAAPGLHRPGPSPPADLTPWQPPR